MAPQRACPLRGIPVCYDKKWGEPWADQPDYEDGLVVGLTETLRSGDRVVIVGGGIGVTAVVAALRTGRSGSV